MVFRYLNLRIQIVTYIARSATITLPLIIVLDRTILTLMFRVLEEGQTLISFKLFNASRLKSQIFNFCYDYRSLILSFA